MSSRRTWRAWGTFSTAVTLTLGCFGGWMLLERPPDKSESSSQSFPVKAGKLTLDMLAGDGDVEVLTGQPGEARVERVLRWDRTKPKVEQSWEGGDTLRVAVTCPDTRGISLSTNCSADYRVWVPPDAAVTAKVGSGGLTVTGVHGELDLMVSDDDVRVSDVSGPLTVRARDAQVIASGLRSPTIDIQGREGKMMLVFVGVPTKVTAILDDGSLMIDLPDEGLYRVNGDVTDGSRTIDVETSDGAPSTIVARVASGSLRIR